MAASAAALRGARELGHVVVALLHGQQYGGFMFQGEILELKGLARPDADTGESGPDILVLRRQWNELEGYVEILEEVCLDLRIGGREEIDLRRSRRRGLFEKRG